jgi:hypothetical protein
VKNVNDGGGGGRMRGDVVDVEMKKMVTTSWRRSGGESKL